jgi:hypothetical protein
LIKNLTNEEIRGCSPQAASLWRRVGVTLIGAAEHRQITLKKRFSTKTGFHENINHTLITREINDINLLRVT